MLISANLWKAHRFGENTGFFENYIVMKNGADTRPVEGTLNALAKQMIESDSGGVAAGWKFKPFLTQNVGYAF